MELFVLGYARGCGGNERVSGHAMTTVKYSYI